MKNRKVAVLGVMDPGIAAIRFAAARGAKVSAFGVATEVEVERINKILNGVSFSLHTEEIPTEALSGFDQIILTPGGGSRYQAQVSLAREKGIFVSTEVELAFSLFASPVIAITGTNGKSTTTYILKNFLEKSSRKVLVCGGDYSEFLEEAAVSSAPDFVVMELASSRLNQVEKIRPQVSVLLNIYPGHAERHKTIQEYADVKAKIFENQTSEDFLVHQLNPMLNELVRQKKCQAKIYQFSYSRVPKFGAHFDRNEKRIKFKSRDGTLSSYDYSSAKLVGTNNVENTMAALCVAKIFKISDAAIQETINTISPLPHRLELVKSSGGIRFFNDAKASNVTATASSLHGFPDHSVILIAGGEVREGQLYKSLREKLSQKVKFLIIFGTKGSKLYKKWGDATETQMVPTLKEATQLAIHKASKGDIVLFSPACRPERHAHRSAQQRGEEFKALVGELGDLLSAKRRLSQALHRI